MSKNKPTMVDFLQEIEENCANVRERVSHWIDLRDNGCNDPFWEDGMNMNLVRNHVLYHQGIVRGICDNLAIPYPAELFIPVPPKVPNTYMADLKSERADKLRNYWKRELVHITVEYDPNERQLF